MLFKYSMFKLHHRQDEAKTGTSKQTPSPYADLLTQVCRRQDTITSYTTMHLESITQEEVDRLKEFAGKLI